MKTRQTNSYVTVERRPGGQEPDEARLDTEHGRPCGQHDLRNCHECPTDFDDDIIDAKTEGYDEGWQAGFDRGWTLVCDTVSRLANSGDASAERVGASIKASFAEEERCRYHARRPGGAS